MGLQKYKTCCFLLISIIFDCLISVLCYFVHSVLMNLCIDGLIYICLGAGLGSWIGDLCSFYTGLFFGPKIKSTQFMSKREDVFLKGEKFFNKYGWGGIVIGRLVPAIRPFIPFIAGLSSMKNITFLFSSVAACIIWTVALAILVIGIDNIISLFN